MNHSRIIIIFSSFCQRKALEGLYSCFIASFAVRAGTGGDEAGIWAGDLVGR